MDVIEVAGWLAAGFTLAAYAMRTMVPLRIAAIGANVLFIVWSLPQGLIPTLVLHVGLLPFNVYRLWEIYNTTQKLRDIRAGANPIEALRPMLSVTKMADGAQVFRKGDAPDHLYFLQSGQVLLEEIDVTLEEGEVFGEIAFLTDARERTVSARCVGACEIARINERTFMRLYSQNPEFGLFIMKLATKRLMDGMATRPQVYQPTGDANPAE